MKSFFFFVGLCFLFLLSNSQVKENRDPCDKVEVFKRFEVEAYTNSAAWTHHLEKNTRVPDSIESKISPGLYKLSVRFVIDTNGNIGEIQLLNDPGFGLANVLVNAISSYTGNWRPASRCGKNVKAYRKQSISFVIPQ